MKPNHNRKRDFQKGQALHVVLKANFQVFWGKQSRDLIDRFLMRYSDYFGVKIYHRALLGNHLHLILNAEDQSGLSGFLRVVAGQISVKLWKAKSLFWQSRPWSRVLKWGKDYGTAIKYVALNYLEGVKRIIRNKSGRTELVHYAELIDDVLYRGLTQLIA